MSLTVISTESKNSYSLSIQTKLDTQAIVEMIKSKQEKGFNLLYDKYCGALYCALIKLVVSRDIADDLLQDTFVKIWKYIDAYDPSKGSLYTWMLNIARNQAIDYLRSSTHKQALLKVNAEEYSDYIEQQHASKPTHNEFELNDFVYTLNHLDAKYSEVIDMIFFNGWTYEQTSRILCLPLGTVKTRARKGLSLLRSLFRA